MIFIGWLVLAAGLAVCWYPLRQLSDMQIGNPQLLFFAFSSASLCTVPWLVYQMKQWRKDAPYLLGVGLSGAVMLTFFHFAILNGNPQTVIGLFCLVPAIIMLVSKLLAQEVLDFTRFLSLVLIIAACLLAVLTTTGGIRAYWTDFISLIAGIACYLFFKLQHPTLKLPIMSRLSVILICSTWMVGMVIIFSPRVVSFPQENANLASVMYGIFCVIPVLLALLHVLSDKKEKHLLLWLALSLGVGVVGSVIAAGKLMMFSHWAPLILLLLSACVLITKLID
ncbi:MAG: hypothetical protein CSB47_08570 [Proteobacteria bacterium]|nr:MAG: hypothetical protein CSB47_08570 [Pseudomonadota bacterium]